MTFAKYKLQIATDSMALSRSEKTAICIVCCKRLAPLYVEFVRRENWGDEIPFAQCRDEAIEHLGGKCDSFSVTAKMLDTLIPDTENFGSLHGSFALKSGVSHLHLIEQLASDDTEPMVGALLMCYETIDFCVQQQLDPQCSRPVPLPDIDAHAMMKREIMWQTGALQRVRANADLVRFATRDFDDSDLASFMLDTLIESTNGG